MVKHSLKVQQQDRVSKVSVEQVSRLDSRRDRISKHQYKGLVDRVIAQVLSVEGLRSLSRPRAQVPGDREVELETLELRQIGRSDLFKAKTTRSLEVAPAALERVWVNKILNRVLVQPPLGSP